MQKQILVLNVGSSSLKFSVFYGEEKIISGICDRIGSDKSYFRYNSEKESSIDLPNHTIAIEKVFNTLLENNVLFDAIAHRVVHGGDLKEATFITDDTENTIEKFSAFAPLHNPFELEVIQICKKFKKPQYAVFDTGFFTDLPPKAFTYPIPTDIAKKYNLRKYGFHGSSHQSISQGEKGRVITCHLGNGASISAIEDGKVLDTSMGLTPLEGLMMGTRSGNIDPGLVIFLQGKGYDMDQVLNFQSGFKAFSPYTDFRDIYNHKEEKNVKLSLDIFLYRIIKYIGAYTAAMNGLDMLIFTAGIGEHSSFARAEICKNFTYLNLKLDPDKNKENQLVISTDDSAITVKVKHTDEELVIVQEVLPLLK